MLSHGYIGHTTCNMTCLCRIERKVACKLYINESKSHQESRHCIVGSVLAY